MKNMFAQMIREEDGQGLVEYGLIIGLVSVLAIGALIILGPKIAAFFTEINTKLV
ncbi:Flp family type IVb pilin [Acetobacterium sp.]|uniref:Flp family type IVb pilin n=1 Tax=Acetobacterium sp. TaxID=1872094 RepID=UPI002F407513